MCNNISFYIGGEEFAELIKENCYYVDKTRFLNDIFLGPAKTKAPLFVRPRRFGKSLNMDMISSFCRINYQNPGDKHYQEEIFLDNGRNLAVAGNEYKELRDNFMGEFPVIFVSFKDIKGDSYIEAIRPFLQTIGDIYREFLFLDQSSKINIADRDTFIRYFKFCNQESLDLRQPSVLSTAEWIMGNFIPFLATMLHKEYNKKVLIIIDEYDVPLQKSVTADTQYYSKMLNIIKQISSRTFKKNGDPWLLKGIVTGCLKIAHQSIFTDANNFVTYGMDANPYAAFFGFTRNETYKLLDYCQISARKETIKEWYDGYRMGNEHLFCPWSVLQYCSHIIESKDNNLPPEPYWVNTSGNDIIELFLKHAINGDSYNDLTRIEQLLNGVPQKISLQEFNTYPDIMDQGVNFESFMTLILQTGYLTFTDASQLKDIVDLRIPNFEIKKCFEVKLKQLYSQSNPVWFRSGKKFLQHLMKNEHNAASKLLEKLFNKFISIRDSGSEHFYHGFIYGILSMVSSEKNIDLKSEPENGDGYSDIIISDRYAKIAVILELKKGSSTYKSRLDAANAATDQIIKRRYAAQFIDENFRRVYGMGVGCGGKSCVIKSLGNLVGKQ
ncbi:MAG: AAA family ATPase [Desulfovibrionaceae bacterium]|nr:AAA family ATPase [Desulfovibrionaceae bacterium]